MRVGVIDLGTNSIRFDIHEIQGAGEIKCLQRYKEMVRLGDEVFRTSRLQEPTIQRSIDALQKFTRLMKKEGVDEIVAAATSAVREAKNAKDFLRRVKRDVGIEIQIISGREEARLIMKGIRAFDTRAKSSFAFVDIGGGSTEIGVFHDNQVLFSESFSLGAARLRQMMKFYPPTTADVDNVRATIRQSFGAVRGFKDWPKIDLVLGASGTVKAIAKLTKTLGHGDNIQKKDLNDLVKNMIPLCQEELLHIPGMEEKRVDIILSGAILLEEI
ncbi:MAG: hypothetical protein COV44_10185, partial [Deltaproteobacteria bacterium CG11_big_fil_rev_8_21_14_0_20_45_16]